MSECVAHRVNRELVCIVYVSDVGASVAFCSDLLGRKTDFASARSVTFTFAQGAFLVMGAGKACTLEGAANRTTEVCPNARAEQVSTPLERCGKGV